MKQSLVLIAEDDELSYKMLTIILAKQGYSFIHATNGKEALDAYLRERPDLVLLDIQMPDMDGIEACKLMRNQEPAGSHTPILAITASPGRYYDPKLKQGLFDEFIAKPYEVKALTEIISNHLQASKVDSNPTPSTSATPSALDVEGALVQVGNDMEVFKEIFSEFLQSLPGRMEQMRANMEKRNMESLARLAHNLKGISANLGANMLSTLSASLEDESDAAHVEAAAEILKKIEEHEEILSQEFHSLREKYPTAR